MSGDVRWMQRFENYGRALAQLTRAVALAGERPLTELENQGLIQAFEFVHELAWNVLKDYLEFEGIEGLVGSRSTVREAFRRGLIAEGEVWMDMIAKRNLSSHTYNVGVATELARAILEQYHPEFIELHRTMQARLAS
jgi:nucleotidyltransferase substrate binding protein (TIGR01987 family)